MEATQKIAEFIVGLEYSQIPSPVIEMAKTAITDCIGVTIAGFGDEIGHILTGWLRNEGGNPRCGVIGCGFKTSPSLAALVTGTAGHALDFDDANLAMHGHPSVPILPVILALGEDKKISGQKALEAYVVGFEVETKVGIATAIPHYLSGWHTTGTLGALGAASAAAKILGLNVERTKMALGIAASLASGLRQNFGSMTKPFHAGHAAWAGLIAAQLASAGFTADANIMETPLGFANVFCGPGKYKFEGAIDKLGNPYGLLELGGLMIKKYPCCAEAHRAIDALLQLIEQKQISADQIKEIICLVQDRVPRVLIHDDPKSGLEGKFSMQHCLAVALLEGHLSLDHFTDNYVLNPRVREIHKKITMKVDPEQKGRESIFTEYSTVIIRMNDGQEFQASVQKPKGSIDNPLTEDELQNKYRDCCSKVLTSESIDKSFNMLRRLEDLDDIGELVDLLTFGLHAGPNSHS